jgi:hypothetical protein
LMFGRVVADRSRYPALHDAALETFGLLAGAIEGCQHAGVVRADDARGLALGAWAMVHGGSMLVVDGQLENVARLSPAELAERVTADLFLGLAARP